MNKERLLNVAKALREAPEPEKFTMIQFVHLAPEGGCGSPACALGHYAFRQDLQSAFTQDTFGPQSGIGCASEEVLVHFGITEMQACQLFDSRGCDDANTPTEAADYIEKFVETDGEHGRDDDPGQLHVAVLPARTKRMADDPRSFLTQDLVVPISPSIGMRNRLTSGEACRRRSGQRMMEPMEDGIRVGLLLVATPQLEDPNFRRSVVLLVEHDIGGGTLGVVLNRPTEVPLDRVLPPWAGLATGPAVVFQGGPVALEHPLALARLPGEDEPLGWRALDGGAEVARVGVVDLEAPPGLLAAELLQLRVFAGYAGWSAGQLRGEVEEGSWYLVPAEAGDVFADRPERLWQDVLRRQGGDLAFVSTFPDDPTLN